MTLFDHFVFNVFQYYRPRFKSKANQISILYVTFLQSSLMLLFGVFFSLFFKQMHIKMISSSKGWMLYFISIFVLYFTNWMSYTGKKRRILNANSTKSKAQNFSIWGLWILPLGCIALAIILLQNF